jgi:hypothetical protein
MSKDKQYFVIEYGDDRSVFIIEETLLWGKTKHTYNIIAGEYVKSSIGKIPDVLVEDLNSAVEAYELIIKNKKDIKSIVCNGANLIDKNAHTEIFKKLDLEPVEFTFKD